MNPDWLDMVTAGASEWAPITSSGRRCAVACILLVSGKGLAAALDTVLSSQSVPEQGREPALYTIDPLILVYSL